MERILIIGGVAAGATAAARARRVSKEAEITILEAGRDISFANCGLPYYISGDIDRRSKLILQSPESFREQYNVRVEVETEVTAIDRDKHTVTARRKGEELTLSYDKLILAQGGKPVVPPIPGVEKSHVFSLWTLEDMDAIETRIQRGEPRKAVVIGGGFIGLEMVEALRKRGIAVDLVERLPHVMPYLEPEIAGYLQEELLAHDVGVYTNAAVTSIGDRTVTLEDGRSLEAEMVLISVGVKPTLTVAQEAGLELGEAGGLLVDETLRTTDPDIFAAGDMVEIEHRVSGRKVRIPLAGPANRQGRVAATNVLGGQMRYPGGQGTSIVKLFEATAGSTGLSLAQARGAGIDAESVVIHKDNHTSYYPGATLVTVLLVYERSTGKILGGQTAGSEGADKRLDVLATAIAAGMSVSDLGELDLAYAPPFGSANDPINMAAFVAENRISGFSPSLTAGELDGYLESLHGSSLAVVDLRDPFSFQRSHIRGSYNVALGRLVQRAQQLPKGVPLLLISDDGKKGHQGLRMLRQAGFEEVRNLLGGYTSLLRHGRALGYRYLEVPLPEVEQRYAREQGAQEREEEAETSGASLGVEGTEPVTVDVRSPEEFQMGAYPGAVNIPLDDLVHYIEELGDKERSITVYCASGARSAYAKQFLESAGFTNVSNGGGLMDMMMRRQ
ncbi:MAG: FAD-dependent oxidoreductase [Alkalispirochaetaceae bacterium]